jgi:hypothetical protein
MVRPFREAPRSVEPDSQERLRSTPATFRAASTVTLACTAFQIRLPPGKRAGRPSAAAGNHPRCRLPAKSEEILEECPS